MFVNLDSHSAHRL